MAGADSTPAPRVHPRTLAVASAGLAVTVLVLAILFAAVQDPLQAAGAEAPREGRDDLDSLDGRIDADNDGIPDATENYVTGSDPNNASSTGGLVPDGWLHRYGYRPLVHGDDHLAASPPASAVPASHGADGARLLTPTLLEVYSFRPDGADEAGDGPHFNGIDPRDWDQNDDGIPDGYLLQYGVDPTRDLADSRLAGPGGLTVREAYQHNTDPTRLDTDGDGIADRTEIAGGPLAGGFTFPPTDPSRYDTNGAGVCDGFLAHQGIDPHDEAAARGDADNDGATAVEEFQWSLQHFGPAACTGSGMRLDDATSGASTIPDGWFVRYDLDPFQAGIDVQVTQKASTDPGPGNHPAGELVLTVLDEYRANRPVDWSEAEAGPWWGGTDPTKTDTDGDGLGDAWEVRGYIIDVSTDVGPGATKTPQVVHPDPTRSDTDGDGITDGAEATSTSATDPVSDATRRDTDLDGLPDGFETDDPDLDPLRADSAGDHMRDGDRHLLLTGRAKAYSESLDYDCPGRCLQTQVTQWLARAQGAKDLLPLDAADAAALVGPRGDVDGDGVANIIDADIDGDGIENGIELDPRLYVQHALGLGPLGTRPATDPLNRDTDGDLLRDDWEVRYGDLDPVLGRYDPEPSDWDTDGDGVADGDEDPDGDGIVWFSYELVGGRTQAQSNNFQFTNLLEQQYETDPRDDDSDDDGLTDGWITFWNNVYPFSIATDPALRGDLYPAPGDLFTILATDQLGSVQTSRFIDLSLADDSRLPHETKQSTTYSTPAPGGGTRTVVELAGTRPYTPVDAQAVLANPFMEDSDGDGLPDAWEAAHRDAPADPECLGVRGPDAATFDADADPDGDELDNLGELQAGGPGQPGTHPLCPDHDHGGVPDGEEARTPGLDPTVPTDDSADLGLDQDHDGVSDMQERKAGTDPLDPDTDGDGLLDGANVPQSGGLDPAGDDARRFLQLGIAYEVVNGDLRFLGEEDFNGDPRDGDDLGIGVPAGWLVARGFLTPPGDPATVRAAYEVGRPAWWDEPTHGPWWGGARDKAEAQNPSGILADPDLDADGLRDDAGEDPYPVANHYNLPADVDGDLYATPATVPDDPRADGLSPLQKRLAAQAVMSPQEITARGPARLADPGALNAGSDHAARAQPTLTADAPPAVDKGTPFQVTGSLASGGTPVGGVTVVARMAGEPVGVAVTAADGTYAMTASIQAEHTFTVPANAFVVLGETGGTVTFQTDTGRIDLGTRAVTVESYATPRTQPYTDTWPALAPATATDTTRVETVPTVAVDHPADVTAGSDVTVTVRVTDGTGDPLPGTVRLTGPHGTEDKPLADGTAQFTLPTSANAPGTKDLTVRFLPDGSFVQGETVQTSISVLRATSLAMDPLPATVEGGQGLPVKGHLTLAGQQTGVPGSVVTVTAGAAKATVTTGGDGRFSTTLTVPEDQDPGSLVVVLSAARTSTTEAATTSSSTNVLALPVLVDQSPLHMTLGEPVPVRGLVRSPDGAAIAGATVRYSLGDRTDSIQTADDGTFATTVDWNPPAGPVIQQLTFVADGTYAGHTVQRERFTISSTFIEVEPTEVLRGAPLLVEARLTDAAGAPLPGVRLTASNEQAPTVGSVTGSDGVAVLELATTGMDLGLQTVRVDFPGSGDGSLLPSAAEADWTVLSALRVHVDDGPFVAGDDPPAARLLDAGSLEPVVRQLQLVNETGSRIVTPGADGRFDLFTDFAPLTEPRAHEWRVLFAGDDAYPPLDETVTVRVLLPTDLNVAFSDRVVSGKAVRLLVTALDPEGGPASGAVTLHLGGEEVARELLRNGRASLPLTPGDPGAADLRVAYGGSLLHAPAEHRETLEVLRPTEVQLEVVSLRGGDARLDVLATRGGEPLSFRTVHVTVEGLPGGIDVTTDKDGRASMVLRDAKESLTVSARLASEAGEEPSIATASIGSAAPGVPDIGYLGLAAAALLAASLVVGLVFAAVALWNRRSPLEQDLRETLRTLRGRAAAEEVILHAYYALQRAALRKGWIEDEAATPRTLQECLQESVRGMPERPLDALIGLFERARYDQRPMGPGDRDLAIRAVTAIRRGTAWGVRA